MAFKEYQIREHEVDDVADNLIGKPYKHGGRGPDFYDCFGLMLALYAGCGIELRDPFDGLDASTEGYRELLFSDFKRIPEDEPAIALDILKQKTPHAHVAVVLPGGYALEARENLLSCRVPVRDIQRLTTGVYRHRCLQVS